MEEDRARIYERAFLLSPEKRNQVMELWEVQKYGADSFSDSDYVCIYGMPPVEWYRRGIRLLARTTVECVRDSLGQVDREGCCERHSRRSFRHEVRRRRPVRGIVQQSLLDFAACEEFEGYRVRNRQNDF